MSETDIFLSYARQDQDSARRFADGFAAEGFTVWWDASLHSGETFDEVIENKLRTSKAVVVLWSPRSVASRWVRAEATLADRRNKLAPAIIEPCDRPIIFELTHAADLTDWTGDISDRRWRKFVGDLRRLVQMSNEERDPAVGGTAAKPAATSARVAAEAPAPAPIPHRRPLRPGSEDVLLAGPAHRGWATDQSNDSGLHPCNVDDDGEAELHCLELDDGDLGKQLFVVEPPGAKIGRAAPTEIVVSHKSVSREHCMVGIANDELLVTDLNSTNGTYIDDERIGRATILPVGSILRLGQISLRHAIRTRAEAAERIDLSTDGVGRGRHAGRVAAAP